MKKDLTPLQALNEIKNLNYVSVADRLIEPIETALKALEIIKTLLSKSGIEVRFNGHKEIIIIWYQKEGEYEDECYYLYKCETYEEYELLKEVLSNG